MITNKNDDLLGGEVMSYEWYKWIDYFNESEFFELRKVNDDNGICVLMVQGNDYIVSSCTDNYIKNFTSDNITSAKQEAIKIITKHLTLNERSSNVCQ